MSPPVQYDIPGNVAKIPEIPEVNPVEDHMTDAVTDNTNDDFEIMTIDPTPVPLEPPLVSDVTMTPAAEEGVHRSTRTQQSISGYEPSMTGKRYG